MIGKDWHNFDKIKRAESANGTEILSTAYQIVVAVKYQESFNLN